MNETQWLACADVNKMREFVGGRASARKLRLYAAACCRGAVRAVAAGRVLPSVEVAEDLADGSATWGEISAATAAVEVLLYETDQDRAVALQCYHEEAGPACFYCCPYCDARWPEAWPDLHPTADGELAYAAMEASVTFEAAGLVAEAVTRALGTNAGEWSEVVAATRTALRQVGQSADEAQGGLLHELFGNPFRRVVLDPAWLRWTDGTVPKMAQAIYDERDFDRLPILADALEEAGCADAAILGHCRFPAEHVRGCWLLDLILDRE